MAQNLRLNPNVDVLYLVSVVWDSLFQSKKDVLYLARLTPALLDDGRALTSYDGLGLAFGCLVAWYLNEPLQNLLRSGELVYLQELLVTMLLLWGSWIVVKGFRRWLIMRNIKVLLQRIVLDLQHIVTSVERSLTEPGHPALVQAQMDVQHLNLGVMDLLQRHRREQLIRVTYRSHLAALSCASLVQRVVNASLPEN